MRHRHLARWFAHPWTLLALLLLLGPWGGRAAAETQDDPPPFPDMAKSVGEVLQEYYYDHKRFQPRVMVERALRALDQAEMAINTTWTNGTINLTVADQAPVAIPAPTPRQMMDAMAILDAVCTKIDAIPSFTPAHRRDLEYDLVNGALTSLDPHTVLLPPEPAKEFGEVIHGEFYGIGAYLVAPEGIVTIERVMAGLPADRAGVEDGDIILKINGERTAGLSLDQAVTRIKGPKGTSVTLTLERKGKDKPLEIPIVRDLVQVISTRAYRAPGGDVGYLRMDDFSANTAGELFDAIDQLERQGPLGGFVLDLRFNGGGLLDAAKTISQFFLPRRREIVRTVTVDGVPDIDRSSSPPILGDVPMIVLVSGGSASAAEILSGALQRNDRAVIAGTITFGKGSVQQIKDLPAGSKLKLTIQEYQLPGGVSIQDVGITPDLALIRHSVTETGDIDLLPYSREREEDDEFALKNTALYQHSSTYRLGWVAPYLTRDEAKKYSISAKQFIPDQEAAMVMDLLQSTIAKAGAKAFSEGASNARRDNQQRQWLLAQLKDAVQAREAQESQALAALLLKHTPSIVWGPASAPAPGSVSISYGGPAEVRAGETAQLRFSLHNASAAEIGRLYGVVNADKLSPLWESEVVFGDCAAGKDTTGVMTFRVPPRLYDGEERFTVDVYADQGTSVIASLPVTLQVLGEPRGPVAEAVDAPTAVMDQRPHFSYAWKLDPVGGVAHLTPGEPGSVLLTLRNDGDAPSAPVKLYVYKADDPYVQLGEVRFVIKDGIPAGGEVVEKVPVTVLKELQRDGAPQPFSADKIQLQIRAEEDFEDAEGNDDISGIYRATLYSTLSIPVGQPVAGGNVVQPEMSLASIEPLPDHQARLRVRIADDAAQLRFVALFQDEDKVDLAPAARLAHLGTTTKDGRAVSIYQDVIRLKPGLNNLRVVASNQNEVTEVLPLRIWGPTPPAPVATTSTTGPALTQAHPAGTTSGGSGATDLP